MENFISGRAESYKSAIKCCGSEDSTSVDSKDSMLEAGEYLERLSFWQRPRQKVDLEFIDVTYRVKQGKKGERNIFFLPSLHQIQQRNKLNREINATAMGRMLISPQWRVKQRERIETCTDSI